MPQPDRQEYIAQELQDVAQAYLQTETNFIARNVFPIVEVEKESAYYNIFDKNALLRDEMQVRPNGGESAGGGFKTSNDQYTCTTYALHKDITLRDRKNWTNKNISIEEATTQYLMQQYLQRLERAWVSDCFTQSEWATDNTPSNLWSDYSASDPIEDVETAKETILKNTGFAPNVGVVGYQVWRKLRNHPDITARITGNGSAAQPAVASRQAVAEILELDTILVAKAVKATNNENATGAYDFIEGKHMLLMHTPSMPSLVMPSAGYTFMFNDVGESGSSVGVYTIPMDHLGRGTVRVETEVSFDFKITGTDLGYLIDDTVA